MFKYEITYKDFDDVEVTETLYFHMTEAELMEMELANDGIQRRYERAMESKDGYSIAQMMKDLILRSYGEKTPDGKRFIKTDEIRDSFKASEAYSKFYVTLIQDEKLAAEFVRKIVPSDLAARSEQAMKEQNKQLQGEAIKAQ